MNTAKTILEGLFGVTFEDHSFGPEAHGWRVTFPWIDQRMNPVYVSKSVGTYLMYTVGVGALDGWAEDQLTERYGSVQAAAEKAAEWLNENEWETLWRTFEPRWCCQRRLDDYLSDIELIAEAVNAGWAGESKELS